MEIQKRKSPSREEYERAVLVLKTMYAGMNYGDLADSKTKQLKMLTKCMERIGLLKEEVDRLPVIHVTGTKGKGSTCIYTEGILRNYGYKTGVFNSPHVIQIRDRILLNGVPVDETLFSSAFWHVFSRLHLTRAKHQELMPSFFVFVLLMALYIFVQEKVDVVVLEVFIGGEFDATNFIEKPVVCGVTSLHVEHTDVLGNTIEEIAWHKAGIMKRGVPMVTVSHQDSVMAVFMDRAKQNQCPVYIVAPISVKELNGLELGISGDIQTLNAALAVQLSRFWRQGRGKGVYYSDANGIDYQRDVTGVDGFTHRITCNLTPEERKGLASARLPGRAQVVKRTGVTYYLDGAHTTDSMQQCVRWFNKNAQEEAAQLGCKVFRTMVFRIKKDKPVEKVLPYLTKCGFCRAAFVPHVISVTDRQYFPDALDLSEDPQTARETSMTQLNVWNQCREQQQQQQKQQQHHQQHQHHLQHQQQQENEVLEEDVVLQQLPSSSSSYSSSSFRGANAAVIDNNDDNDNSFDYDDNIDADNNNDDADDENDNNDDVDDDDDEEEEETCPSYSFPSIVSALWWAGLSRDRPLERRAKRDLSQENGEPTEGDPLEHDQKKMKKKEKREEEEEEKKKKKKEEKQEGEEKKEQKKMKKKEKKEEAKKKGQEEEKKEEANKKGQEEKEKKTEVKKKGQEEKEKKEHQEEKEKRLLSSLSPSWSSFPANGPTTTTTAAAASLLAGGVGMEGSAFVTSTPPTTSTTSATDAAHVQVLVTGSMHLVGGALSLLQPDFWH